MTAPSLSPHQPSILQDIGTALRAHRSFLVGCHANPDGDAIGSLLAMGHLIESLGPERLILFCADPVPYNLRFLPLSTTVVSKVPDDATFDCTVVLDCGELERVGQAFPPRERLGLLVVLDHHVTSAPLGDLSLVDPTAAAVGMLINDLALSMGIEVSLPMAQCIYTAILTDTGSFHYSNTTSKALALAAQLVDRGVSPWDMASQIYESHPFSRIQLLARSLNSIQLDLQGRLAVIWLKKADFEDTGCDISMIDGIVNYARSIQGVEVAAQIREKGPGRWKISMRSRGAVDVSLIAQAFGGGGHRNAAGFDLAGGAQDVEAKVRQAVAGALDPQSP